MLPLIQTGDRALQALQSTWKALLDPILKGKTVKKVQGDFAATSDVSLYRCDASAKAIIGTLPEPTAGLILRFKKIDSTGHSVTMAGSIDGGTSTTLTAQWKAVTLMGDGSTWNIIGTF